MTLAATILSILLALVFVGAGLPKVTGSAKMAEQLDFLGVSAGLGRLIGVLELAGAAGLVVGLWLGPIGAAAAAGLVLLMAGAVVYHVRAGDAPKNSAGPGLFLLLAAVVLVLRIATL